MAYHNILQWNCRGIQANFNELQIIANDFNIGIFLPTGNSIVT